LEVKVVDIWHGGNDYSLLMARIVLGNYTF